MLRVWHCLLEFDWLRMAVPEVNAPPTQSTDVVTNTETKEKTPKKRKKKKKPADSKLHIYHCVVDYVVCFITDTSLQKFSKFGKHFLCDTLYLAYIGSDTSYCIIKGFMEQVQGAVIKQVAGELYSYFLVSAKN